MPEAFLAAAELASLDLDVRSLNDKLYIDKLKIEEVELLLRLNVPHREGALSRVVEDGTVIPVRRNQRLASFAAEQVVDDARVRAWCDADSRVGTRRIDGGPHRGEGLRWVDRHVAHRRVWLMHITIMGKERVGQVCREERRLISAKRFTSKRCGAKSADQRRK